MSMVKPCDLWKMAVGERVQRGLDEKTATPNISKEMAEPEE